MANAAPSQTDLNQVFDLVNDEFFIMNQISESENENSYIVERIGTIDIASNDQMIMDASPNTNCPFMLKKIEIYTALNTSPNRRYLRMHYNGIFYGHRVIVLSQLGQTIEERRETMPNQLFPLNQIVRIGIELIRSIEELHAAGYIHGNICPLTCSFGDNDNSTMVCLTYFSQSHMYRSSRKQCEACLDGTRATKVLPCQSSIRIYSIELISETR